MIFNICNILFKMSKYLQTFNEKDTQKKDCPLKPATTDLYFCPLLATVLNILVYA